jgi:hypothetical protein
MASTKSILNRSARELIRMCRDLQTMFADRDINWSEPRPAPATLASDAPVTPWRFALHFLANFEEWRQTKFRWTRLFGEDPQPRRWRSTEERCLRIARRAASEAQINRAFTADRLHGKMLSRDEITLELDTDVGFDRVMEAQRVYHLASFARSISEYQSGLPDLRSLEQLRANLHRELSFLPPNSAANLEWHLCHYRNALLLARCLQPEGGEEWPTHVFLERNPNMKLSDLITTNPQLRIELPDHLRETLNTLGDLISELGFEGTCEQLASSDFDSFPTPGASRQPINIIPGGDAGKCTNTVVALFQVAGQRKQDRLFRHIMAQLKTHLLQCQGTTKCAVLITDWWDSEVFLLEHAAELAEWRRKGVQILVLLVSQPGSLLTPLRIW